MSTCSKAELDSSLHWAPLTAAKALWWFLEELLNKVNGMQGSICISPWKSHLMLKSRRTYLEEPQHLLLVTNRQKFAPWLWKMVFYLLRLFVAAMSTLSYWLWSWSGADSMSGCILRELAVSLLKKATVVLYFVPSLLLLRAKRVCHWFLRAEPSKCWGVKQQLSWWNLQVPLPQQVGTSSQYLIPSEVKVAWGVASQDLTSVCLRLCWDLCHDSVQVWTLGDCRLWI